MAFGNFTLTGQFLGLTGIPAAGRVHIDGIPQTIIDTAGNKFKVGPRYEDLDTQGAVSISLPSNATTGTSTTIAFRVTVNLKHQNIPPVEFYAPAIGATVDLADIVPQQISTLTPTPGRYTTAARPSAATSGAGTQIYDTTLSKPIWSDGTAWRDATGTIV